MPSVTASSNSSARARIAVAVAAVAACLPWLVPSAGAAPSTPSASSAPSMKVSPVFAKPGETVTVTGSAPGCPAQPYQTAQDYTDFVGSRVQAMGTGGVAGLDGSFHFSVKVPAKASRTDILRPFSAFQYDTVAVTFPGCHGGTTIGANVTVLPFNRQARIYLTPSDPRSGAILHVRVTHCRGAVLPQFTELVDRTGEYFHIKGSVSGSTFTGSTNLKHGFYGDDARGGPAHPSPRGVKDSVVAIACTQSEGPRWVARQDLLWHSNMVVDVHIARAR